MSDYAAALSKATARGTDAYNAITEWLDRPPSSSEQIPTAELEKKVKELRASRAQLLDLRKTYGDESDIVDALKANTSLFSQIGVSLPEED